MEHTRNGQIVECHWGETRKHTMVFGPLSDSINNVFYVS